MTVKTLGSFISNTDILDDTAPSTQASADAAAPGTAVVAARLDHKHGMPTIGGTVTSGIYTPTVAAVTNSASPVAYECQYAQIGSTVFMSGRVGISSSASGDTVCTVTLPVASNLGTQQDLGGLAISHSTVMTAACMYASSADDKANLIFISVSAQAYDFFFTFQYQVI